MLTEAARDAYDWCYAASCGTFSVSSRASNGPFLVIFRWDVRDAIDSEWHGAQLGIQTMRGDWDGRTAYLEGQLEAFLLDARRHVGLMFPNHDLRENYLTILERDCGENIDVASLRKTPSTCTRCPMAPKCKYAFDPYNSNGDCLAEK
jgi:hypothetical protein